MVATGNRDIVYEQIFRRLKAEEWYSAYRTSLFLSMSQTNILIFGATGTSHLLVNTGTNHTQIVQSIGYVAGTLLLRLLELPHVSITVLVRSADKAEKLRKLNLGPLKVVEGSPTTDAALLVDLLKDTDLLIDSVSVLTIEYSTMN